MGYYKGIETENAFINGSWQTTFWKHETLLKTVVWRESFDFEDCMKVIDEEILPFI